MASTDQTTKDITTAVTPHNTGDMAVTDSPDAADTIEPSDGATINFTQQDTPLLRLPGELRNRVYHEVFQTVCDELEENKGLHAQWDPRVLRRLLAALTACRQIHQEAMPILIRTYVADKLYWCIRSRGRFSLTNFFKRVDSFCQTMKRHAPHARFGVEPTTFSPRK